MKVRFSVVSEFIAELETDTALIEDKLLRVTVCYQPVRDLPRRPALRRGRLCDPEQDRRTQAGLWPDVQPPGGYGTTNSTGTPGGAAASHPRTGGGPLGINHPRRHLGGLKGMTMDDCNRRNRAVWLASNVHSLHHDRLRTAWSHWKPHSGGWPTATISSRSFGTLLTLSALTFSNVADLINKAVRETQYLSIVNQYTPDEFQTFPQLLGLLVACLEHEQTDVLGQLYHRLELHNEQSGQFFTPYPVCLAMAKMLVHDAKHLVHEQEFIRAHEPCVGSGAMVIALAQALKEEGINYPTGPACHSHRSRSHRRAHSLCAMHLAAHPSHHHARRYTARRDVQYLAHTGACDGSLGCEACPRSSPPACTARRTPADTGCTDN